MGELDVDDGLSGMVAFMKMSESRFRCRVVSMRVVSDAAECDDGVCDRCGDRSDVSSGESICRFARGELGRPYGDIGDCKAMMLMCEPNKRVVALK